MSAQATIDRLTPGQVRIVLRGSRIGVAGFVGFVLAVVAAIYGLAPAARAQPAPLVWVVAVALGWAELLGAPARSTSWIRRPAR